MDRQPADAGIVAPSADMRQHESRELAEKIREYETGEKGKLNPIFPGSLRHWLDHCCELGELNILSGFDCFGFLLITNVIEMGYGSVEQFL